VCPACLLIVDAFTHDVRTALVVEFMAHLDEQQCEDLVTKLLRSEVKAEVGDSGAMLAALKHLDPDERNNFADLTDKLEDKARAEFIQTRISAPKAVITTRTPPAIKALRPNVKGARIVLNKEHGAFEGYYPYPNPNPKQGSKQHSRSRSYLQKWTKLSALKQVVDGLWKWRKNHGGVEVLTNTSDDKFSKVL
jgi:hypothetical protein